MHPETVVSTLDYLKKYRLLLLYFLGMKITISDNLDYEKVSGEVFLLTTSNIKQVYIRRYFFSKCTLFTIWERLAKQNYTFFPFH
jgi:membrane protein CcdC involved in cytochrome C biogenesis